MISLTLPYPPTINHMYGQRPRGARYLKPAGVEFKKQVADIVSDAGAEKITGSAAVFIVAYMPDKRKRDLDNLLKITLDSLTGAGVWIDDSQLVDIHITKHWEVVKGGQLKIVVREVDDAIK